jgi:hypothetical protein
VIDVPPQSLGTALLGMASRAGPRRADSSSVRVLGSSVPRAGLRGAPQPDVGSRKARVDEVGHRP